MGEVKNWDRRSEGNHWKEHELLQVLVLGKQKSLVGQTWEYSWHTWGQWMKFLHLGCLAMFLGRAGAKMGKHLFPLLSAFVWWTKVAIMLSKGSKGTSSSSALAWWKGGWDGLLLLRCVFFAIRMVLWSASLSLALHWHNWKLGWFVVFSNTCNASRCLLFVVYLLRFWWSF